MKNPRHLDTWTTRYLIPDQPCIVLFRIFFPGTPASNRRECELRLHLNVVTTGAGVFKSRHILLHKYVNRIMITYLWCQIQLFFNFFSCPLVLVFSSKHAIGYFLAINSWHYLESLNHVSSVSPVLDLYRLSMFYLHFTH